MTVSGDRFDTLYQALQAKLKDSTSTATTRCKVAINDAVREICREEEFRFLIDADNPILGTGARQYSLSANDFGHITNLRVSTAKQMGDTTTQIAVTNPVGTTYRYTYTGVGSDPHIGLLFNMIGDYFTFTGFSAGNNVTNGVVTGVGLNYIEITNAAGAVETVTGTVILGTSINNGVHTRRTWRAFTVQQGQGLLQSNLVQGTTSWNTTLTDNPYAYIDQTTIQFKLPITTNQVIWYDYRKNVASMVNDSDICVIPSGESDVIVQLAFATMMQVDDDTRFKDAYAKYQVIFNKMKKNYIYSDCLDDTGQIGGYLDS